MFGDTSDGRRGRRATAVLLAVALVLSPIVAVGVIPTSATAAPAGMATVPDAQIYTDMPKNSESFEQLGITVEDLEGSVYAEAGKADTLEVILTTPGRARGRMDADTVLGSGPIAIVFKDTSDHDGREIAVDKSVLRKALDRTPEMARVTHNTGDKHRDEITYSEGAGTFYVSEFSENTVTFAGEVNITGKYGSGSSVAYDLSDYEAATDPNITFTGVTNSETDTHSFSTGTGGSESYSFNVAGSESPTSESLTIDGAKRTKTDLSDAGDVFNTISYTWSNPTATLSEASIDVETSNCGSDITVTVYVDGSQVGSKTTTMECGGTYTYTVYNLGANPSSSVTVEATAGASGQAREASITSQNPQSVSATVDGSTYNFGTVSSAESKSITASQGSNTLDVSWEGGSVLPDVSYDEHQVTADPALTLNGQQQASYTGTLGNGSTATYTGNKSDLQSGTNTVNVSTSSPSSDAPATKVDVQYRHTAENKKSVNYTAGKWVEKYNVSTTYASAQENADLTIPHESNVVAVGRVQKSVNGGTWQDVSSGNYNLDGTTLTVQFGAVSANDTVAVRTTGRVVKPQNGSITVTDPTSPGERLDSKIRLDSWGADSHLAVGGSGVGKRIHYAYSSGYSTDEHSVIKANGANQLHLPAASDGSELRVSTIPVTADAESGKVRVEVSDPQTTEPKFDVSPAGGSGDTVHFTFVTAADDQKYILWSKTNGVVRDEGTANSPLTLIDDDSDELLQFLKEDSSGGGGGGGGGVVGAVATAGSGISLPGVSGTFILLGVVGLAGFVAIRRYTGFSVPSLPDLPGGGGGSSGSGRSSGRSSGGGITGFVTTVLRTAGSIVTRTLGFFIGRPRVAAGAGVIGLALAIRADLIVVPQRALTALLIGGAVLGAYLLLRVLGAFSWRVFAVVAAMMFLLGASAIAPGAILPAIGTSLQELLPLFGIVAAYLAVKWIRNRGKEKATPDKVVNLSVSDDDN